VVVSGKRFRAMLIMTMTRMIAFDEKDNGRKEEDGGGDCQVEATTV